MNFRFEANKVNKRKAAEYCIWLVSLYEMCVQRDGLRGSLFVSAKIY